MKTRLHLLAIPVMLALAACRPGTAEYTEAEAPNLLRVDSAATHLELAFAAGSYQLSPREAGRLHELARSGRISPEDRVTISTSGDPFLREHRVATISSELLRFGIVAAASPVAGVPRDHAVIAVGRYMISLPACPNWSQASASDFTNAKSSNFGCATASNFGLMVSSPADLVSGRALGLTSGRQAVAAVQRYNSEAVNTPKQFDGAAASPGSIAGAALSASGGGK
jgi:pilus assembly protein CpaD